MPEPSDLHAPPFLSVDAWCAVAGLRHGFFGRRGGCSAGPLGTLNVSYRVSDDVDAVASNWGRVGMALPGLHIVGMRQVHGSHMVRVEGPDQVVGEADGMLTDTAGIGLAVLTADCVPILAVAPAARAVMAVHAGWRGTVAGVAAEAVRVAQRSCGIAPEMWRVGLGPSIDACCYEVEREIGERAVSRWGEMPDAWQPAGQHGRLDLRTANRHILAAAGVRPDHIERIGPCTGCRADEYFSHRRSGGRAGRQVSVIGWAT